MIAIPANNIASDGTIRCLADVVAGAGARVGGVVCGVGGVVAGGGVGVVGGGVSGGAGAGAGSIISLLIIAISTPPV